jgi:hypothetical protein
MMSEKGGTKFLVRKLRLAATPLKNTRGFCVDENYGRFFSSLYNLKDPKSLNSRRCKVEIILLLNFFWVFKIIKNIFPRVDAEGQARSTLGIVLLGK